MSENTLKCPYCSSEQITSNQQGFGVGKAVVGTVLAGPLVGVAAGAMGRKKIKVTCLACGREWKPGEHEQIQKEQSMTPQERQRYEAACQSESTELFASCLLGVLIIGGAIAVVIFLISAGCDVVNESIEKDKTERNRSVENWKISNAKKEIIDYAKNIKPPTVTTSNYSFHVIGAPKAIEQEFDVTLTYDEHIGKKKFECNMTAVYDSKIGKIKNVRITEYEESKEIKNSNVPTFEPIETLQSGEPFFNSDGSHQTLVAYVKKKSLDGTSFRHTQTIRSDLGIEYGLGMSFTIGGSKFYAKAIVNKETGEILDDNVEIITDRNYR